MHLAQRPDSEDVTLAVCDAVGREALERVAPTEKASRRNTDLGPFVVQKLVELFGDARVLTLRQDDGKSAHTRSNLGPSRDGVTAYTPHRVIPATSCVTDRILLDTSVVRKVIHADLDALDLVRLKQLHAEHPGSLSDGSIAELASALFEGRVKIDDWAARIYLFDDIIDPDLPFAPGGIELSALAGLRDAAGLDLDAMRSHLRAIWKLFRAIKTDADLSRKVEYETAAGQRFQIGLDGLRTKRVLADTATHWKEWVDKARADKARMDKAEVTKSGEVLEEEELCHLQRNVLSADLSPANLDKLDVAIRVIAKRTAQLKSFKGGYNAEGYNDALDFDLLFGLALPAVVCTGDDRLVRLAHSTTASEAWRVLNAATLLDWLAKERC